MLKGFTIFYPYAMIMKKLIKIEWDDDDTKNLRDIDSNNALNHF